MAYAALKSLRFTLCSVIVRKLTESEEHDFVSLRESLEQLDFDWYKGIDMSEINELDAKIREAAWKLEDVLESYQISQWGLDLEGVEQEIHFFFDTANKLREEYEEALSMEYDRALFKKCDRAYPEVAANSTTIGLSDLSQQIITRLLHDDKIHVFKIWGMAGIGKTHLARDIYHHPLIVQHFDFRLWVTIGQVHDGDHIKNIYMAILAQIEHKPRDAFKEKDTHELRDLIYNTLLHRTYFIVLDDIWSWRIFNVCKRALPYYQNEQRILVTTRTRDVLWEDYKVWEMPFLSDEESWELLSQNVFGNKPLPSLLEKPGRKIAHLCEGLPLLILTVADILCDLDQTQEFWNKVAQRKTTTFTDAYDRIYEVLVLSYDYLEQLYKAPFLYMGIFPQGHVILVSKLINLWMIEDYNYLSLKMIASSSLAIVCKFSSFSEFKSCKLHCTYWYVCVTEARKNRLFHVLHKLSDVLIESPRRLAVQNNMLFGLKEVCGPMAASTSLTRSLLFTGEDHQYPVQICFNAMLLLKVLDALAIRFYEFPNEVADLLLLRYLALTHHGEVPSSISNLQRLRFLILRQHHNIKSVERKSTTYLPYDIWGLQRLEYLRIMGSTLPDPYHEELSRLLRLYVNASSCTRGVMRGTPILKKLGIDIELQPDGGIENSMRCLEHTRIQHYLESLKCVVVNPRLSNSQVVGPLDHHLSNLPQSLKKLSLKGMGYPWKYTSVIGKLPHLQVLKLRCSAFRGPKWEIKRGEFRKLTYLLLEDIDVEHWTVKGLENLNNLIIGHCYKLKMIPYRDFQNMKRLEVDECSPSLVEFAQKIKVNSSCEVVISSSWNL